MIHSTVRARKAYKGRYPVEDPNPQAKSKKPSGCKLKRLADRKRRAARKAQKAARVQNR